LAGTFKVLVWVHEPEIPLLFFGVIPLRIPLLIILESHLPEMSGSPIVEDKTVYFSSVPCADSPAAVNEEAVCGPVQITLDAISFLRHRSQREEKEYSYNVFHF